VTTGSRVTGPPSVTLPAPWQPTNVGGGVWFANRRDVPGVREHCPRGEQQARSLADRYNRDAARDAIDQQVAAVAALAVEWLERREDGEIFSGPDDRLADAARVLRTMRELYDDRYPDLGPL
jgi:hypothetical protein